jgi:hypothetical protein
VPEGFTYHREEDYWLCRQGKKATFRMEIINAKGNNVRSKLYRATCKDGKGCPLKESCISKQHQKSIFAPLLKHFLEATMTGELEAHLQEERAAGKPNRKNGKTSKQVKSLSGEFEQETIDVSKESLSLNA